MILVRLCNDKLMKINNIKGQTNKIKLANLCII